MYEETAADKEQRIREDEEFIKLVEKTCEVKGATALAALQPEKRDALEKFFGSYGAESMMLASDPDSILWTDDLIQAQTSAQEFGSRRVWTQIVLGALADLGLLTAEEYGKPPPGCSVWSLWRLSLTAHPSFQFSIWLPGLR